MYNSNYISIEASTRGWDKSDHPDFDHGNNGHPYDHMPMQCMFCDFIRVCR